MKKTLLPPLIPFVLITLIVEFLVREGFVRPYLLRSSRTVTTAMLISMATILVRMADLGARGERWLWVGAVALIGIGGQAFVRNARAAHFEGFVLVISVALVMQGLLMLVSGIGLKGARSS